MADFSLIAPSDDSYILSFLSSINWGVISHSCLGVATEYILHATHLEDISADSINAPLPEVAQVKTPSPLKYYYIAP